MQEHFPSCSALPLLHARLLLLSITRRHVYHFFYMVSQMINSTRRLSSLASMSPLLRRTLLLLVLLLVLVLVLLLKLVLVLLVLVLVLVLVRLVLRLLLLLLAVVLQTQEISSSRLFTTWGFQSAHAR